MKASGQLGGLRTATLLMYLSGKAWEGWARLAALKAAWQQAVGD